MLIIRKEQFAVFQKVASQSFESQMLSHIRKCFRKQMEELGEPRMREVIRYGIQRSASYRIRKQRDICMYIDMMIVFGRDFDRDPALPWASRVLEDKSLPGPTGKIIELQKAAVECKTRGEVDDGES
jgi:hypothetical protein